METKDYEGYHKTRINGKTYRTCRLVAEEALGKPLPPKAEVHHVNRDTRNDQNSNLVICPDRTYHQLLHSRHTVQDAGGNPNTDLVCSDCNSVKKFAEFNKNRARVSGYCNLCKVCDNKRNKDRWQKKKIGKG